jgi:hypothetical protein
MQMTTAEHSDHVLLENDRRRRELADRVYVAFLREVGNVPEREWRFIAIRSINRLMEGIECSFNAEMMREHMQELGALDPSTSPIPFAVGEQRVSHGVGGDLLIAGLSYDCHLLQNAFGRWIVVNVDSPFFAWSGSRWVRIDERGLPAGGVQISNFATRGEAEQTAREQGLTVRDSIQRDQEKKKP